MISKLLAAIRLQTDATPLADAARLVERARAEHEEAARQLDAAREAYTASLVADDDKAAIGAYVEVDRRKVLLARAAAAIELAEKVQAEAAERDAEAGRRQRYTEAQARIRTAVKALEAYPEHARAIRDIFAAVAHANVAMGAANADLPAGAKPLRSAEAQVRGVPGAPERELSREALGSIWHFTGPQEMWGEVSPLYWSNIRETGPGKGVLERRDPESKLLHEFPVETRAGGTRVITMPEKAGVMPEALHTQVMLPGLHAADPVIWSPVGNLSWGYEIGQDGHAVLEAVVAREAAPSRTIEEMQPDGAPLERIEPPATRAAA
ncbi:hypothetical protein [Methylobacterium mesophilicum]|uniref:hypothetical protein n=1 Tax=Methylobacterium mesophilicum TaxID=39956 RepID=UPI002F319A07